MTSQNWLLRGPVCLRAAKGDDPCSIQFEMLSMLCDLPRRTFSGSISNMKKKKSAVNARPFSSILVDGPDRAAARAMLYPVGFTEADFKKPIIGVASTWSNVTPCNMHIDKLALESEKGTNRLPLRLDRGEGQGEVTKFSQPNFPRLPHDEFSNGDYVLC
jgi:hypothetical protein